MDQKSLQPARPMDSLLRTPQHPRRRPPGSQRWPQSLRDYCLLSIGQVEHYSGASQDDYLRDSIAWATSAMWKGCAVPYLSYEFVQECEIFGLSFRLPIPRSASCPARLYRLSKFWRLFPVSTKSYRLPTELGVSCKFIQLVLLHCYFGNGRVIQQAMNLILIALFHFVSLQWVMG